MTTLVRSRPGVKPTRRSARPPAPFGAGLIETSGPGPAGPLDCRTLPTIYGAGLTPAEADRVNGARNRARAAYAQDCPDAPASEVEGVARRAATDELRRTL